MNRREFTKNTAIATAMAAAIPYSGFSNTGLPTTRTIKKGIMWGEYRLWKNDHGEISKCQSSRF